MQQQSFQNKLDLTKQYPSYEQVILIASKRFRKQ